MIVLEVIAIVFLVAMVVAIVSPVIWARRVGGSPRDRVMRAKTEREVAQFNAEAARFKLETEQLEAQRRMLSEKTAEELQAIQDRSYQKELEKAKKVRGEIINGIVELDEFDDLPRFP